MKVVFVRPNYNSHIITPPLGLGYLSSYLKKNGVETRVVDGLRDNLGMDALVAKILSEKPDAVGITCLTAFYSETVRLSRALKEKKPGLKCIIGGVHPTFLPFETLADSKADFVVCGEGEAALLKLARNGFANVNIRGVYHRENTRAPGDEIERAEIIEDLDEIPFPDWEQIDPNTYPIAPHGAIVKNTPIGVITTTRGCPYKCTFCASPGFYNRKIRYRSPENVVNEIKYLVDRFGVKEIHFEDDNLTLKRSHIEGICNLLIENNIRISWACPNGIRADKVDAELIGLMKRSGCYYFAYGIESANSDILKNIKKLETIEVIEESIRAASEAGISCQGFFIFGLPGETKQTVEETVQFARKSKLSRAQFLILDVIPGSELWEELKGQFKPCWDKNSFKEPEWIPAGLTKKDLMKAQSRAFRVFYLRPGIFFGLARSVKLRQAKFMLQRLSEYRIFRE